MDIVLPIKKGGSYWKDRELRYCLRSIEKYFLDLGKVYIIGYKPSWVKNVIHISHDDSFIDNKGANIISKLIRACKDERITDSFLFVSDDQYFLKPLHARQIHAYYNFYLNHPYKLKNKFWRKCMSNVKRVMNKEGLPAYCYEPHTPLVINKRKYWSTMLNYNWQDNLFPTLSLYFNTIKKNHKRIPDNYRARFAKLETDLSIINDKSFLSHDDMGLSNQLQDKLKELFPEKSKFEK